MSKVHYNQNPNWATCTNCLSPPEVLCRSAQCYLCFKSRILRIFKQTFRTKIMSKVNSLTESKLNNISESDDKNGFFCNGKLVKKRLKIAIVCSDPKYGLGRGIYAAKLLFHLLLMRNAHRKRLFEDFNINYSDGLEALLMTDDIEISGFYIIGDLDFCNGNQFDFITIPKHRLYIRDPNIFKEIDSESVEAGSYCRNLEALNLLATIPVDIILISSCLEDVALSSLHHSMFGLGGDAIIRNQYLQPLSGLNGRLFIGRPFRDFTAKEIYLLARHENLIDGTSDYTSIDYLYQMEFIYDIGARHPNSLTNIAKLTEGYNSNCDILDECIICKFRSNLDNQSICYACLEVSNLSSKARSFLVSYLP